MNKLKMTALIALLTLGFASCIVVPPGGRHGHHGYHGGGGHHGHGHAYGHYR